MKRAANEQTQLPKRPYLVQRLRRPIEGRVGLIADAFAFGGGLANGGLSKDAMAIVRQAFSFDYMGAAEFEWGAVPNALGRIAKERRDLAAWSFLYGELRVYAISLKAWRTAVESEVGSWIEDPYACRLKEQPRIKDVARGEALDVCGWLELDNGFFVFTDETMWRTTAAIFDVEVGS